MDNEAHLDLFSVFLEKIQQKSDQTNSCTEVAHQVLGCKPWDVVLELLGSLTWLA